MSEPKIAVIPCSTYGTSHAVAEAAAHAAAVAGAEVRLRRIAETAPEAEVKGQEARRAQVERTGDIPAATADDMIWADGYFISAPTRFGVSAGQLRAFIDTLGGV